MWGVLILELKVCNGGFEEDIVGIFLVLDRFDIITCLFEPVPSFHNSQKPLLI